ncbi:MAG: hypothetical protein JW827_05640 [Spirochaetes bacterium]|nr:hypothetical protein [Spirochaetota bacterium]
MTFDYAEQRLNNKDYYRAITEFKRYSFFGRDVYLREKSRYNIGLCYLRGGEYKNARSQFEMLYYDKKNPFSELALLSLGDVDLFSEIEQVKVHESYFFNKPHFDTLNYIRYMKNYPLGEYYSEAYTKLTLAALLNFNFKMSYDLVNRADAKEWKKEHARIMEELPSLLKQASQVPERSETFATILSIFIPGSGQIYAGEVKEGLLALGVNALFLTACIYTYTNYSKFLGIFLGYYELSFYIGNIQNAAWAVEKYNENARNCFRSRVIDLYIKRF